MIPAGAALNHDKRSGEPLEVERRAPERLFAVQRAAVDPEHEVAAPDADLRGPTPLADRHHLAAPAGEHAQVHPELLAEEGAGQRVRGRLGAQPERTLVAV